MSIVIHTIVERLSDGSEAYAVVTHDDELPSGECTRYEMISEKDALAFGRKLAAAIEAHTNHSIAFN